jgi:hypothetical protein
LQRDIENHKPGLHRKTYREVAATQACGVVTRACIGTVIGKSPPPSGRRHHGDYRIRVEFNDGTKGVVDLQETIFNDSRPIFAALREKELFRRFRVEMDTAVWENGLDLAPEFLYDLAIMPAGQRRSA